MQRGKAAVMIEIRRDVVGQLSGADLKWDGRINVAISRAKGLALVFGSPRLREAKCNSVGQMQLVNTLCALPSI